MAGERELTREEVIRGIQSDLGTAFNFIIDNNYDGLVAQLRENGFSPDNEEQALENLKFLYEFDRPKLVDILGKVTYENNANNWTAGFDDVFRPNQAPTTRSTEGGNVWGSILGGLGGLLTGVAGSMTSPSGAPLTAEQIEAQRVAAAAEKKRKDRNTIIIVLVIVAAIIAIAIYMNKKGKKKG